MPLAIFPRDHLAEAGWRGREALAGYDALIACGGAFCWLRRSRKKVAGELTSRRQGLRRKRRGHASAAPR